MFWWRDKFEKRLSRAIAECLARGGSAPCIHLLCAQERDVVPAMELLIERFPACSIGGPLVERIHGGPRGYDLGVEGPTVFVGRIDEACFLYLRALRLLPEKRYLFEWSPAVFVNYEPQVDADVPCILEDPSPYRQLRLRIGDFVAIFRNAWHVRGTFSRSTPRLAKRPSSFEHHMTHRARA